MMVVKIKKQTTQKSVLQKLNFEDYKNCLEIENKTNHLKKKKINGGIYKEFIKKNKLILKTQQRFRSEKHNVFTEEIIKITLSSNDHKKIQPIDSIETYAYGTSKDIVCKKLEIKCNNIIKQYKNVKL